MTTVQFYYSLGSRYSYLAMTQLAKLQESTGCQVDWHPLNSVTLLARRGIGPFSGSPVSGQYEWLYRERDARRWAAYYGVPFVEPRGRVEFDPQQLAIAAVAAKRLGHAEGYSRAVFSAMFVDPAVRSIDRNELVRLAEACSIASSRFEAELDNPATAAELSQSIDEAHRLGVFGVPTFIIGDEAFWGNDRLVLLSYHLTQRYQAE
mgnify:FL=1